jgi:hypothetical protein
MPSASATPNQTPEWDVYLSQDGNWDFARFQQDYDAWIETFHRNNSTWKLGTNVLAKSYRKAYSHFLQWGQRYVEVKDTPSLKVLPPAYQMLDFRKARMHDPEGNRKKHFSFSEEGYQQLTAFQSPVGHLHLMIAGELVRKYSILPKDHGLFFLFHRAMEIVTKSKSFIRMIVERIENEFRDHPNWKGFLLHQMKEFGLDLGLPCSSHRFSSEEEIRSFNEMVERVFHQLRTIPVMDTFSMDVVVWGHQENMAKLIYVVKPDSSLAFCVESLSAPDGKAKRLTHSQLSDFRPVLAAGEILCSKRKEEEKWEIVRINNSSGHYHPRPDDCLSDVLRLLQDHLSGLQEDRFCLSPDCSLVNVLSIPTIPYLDQTTQVLGSARFAGQSRPLPTHC